MNRHGCVEGHPCYCELYPKEQILINLNQSAKNFLQENAFESVFITRVSEVIMFSPCVFVCLFVCVFITMFVRAI